MGEKNLDKKMTNSVSYDKLWTEVARKLVVRKDVRFVSVIWGGLYE